MKTRRRATRATTLLFIGNSFTARNNLPGLVAALAASVGRTVEQRLISAGGASLRTHWNAGAAGEAIATGRFEFVVLQEQSTLPIKNAARMGENVRLFDERIRAAGSQTALYTTWARSHSPESQETISAAYTSIGREIGAAVVPVGMAWQHVLSLHEHPVLHDKDGSHPTPAGTYLAACVFLATLLNADPREAVGLDGLAASDATLLQRIAWQTARERCAAYAWPTSFPRGSGGLRGQVTA